MYIILDRPTHEEFDRIYDHINNLDGKIIGDQSDAVEYTPNGPEHILYEIELSDKPERWGHLCLAALGARLYSNRVDENHWAFNSPLFAGPIPPEDKTRKVAVDGAFAEGRAGYFQQFGVNYIGRTNVDPQNIFVLDNKKGNPRHSPAVDTTLEALYDSLPDDWWHLCGFVSTNNITKLEAFLEAVPSVIPIAYTTGGMAKMKSLGFDYVEASTPTPTPDYGIRVRDAANRLSYKLSLTPEELEAHQKAEIEHQRRAEIERKRALGIT